MSTDIPEKTRKLALERCDGRCELCRAPMTDLHHLEPKGMGGTSRTDIHGLSNLLCLDRKCHGWVHQNVARSEAAGWIRPTSGLWMQSSNYAYPGWFQPTDDGLVVWLSDEAEPAHMPPWVPRLSEAFA